MSDALSGRFSYQRPEISDPGHLRDVRRRRKGLRRHRHEPDDQHRRDLDARVELHAGAGNSRRRELLPQRSASPMPDWPRRRTSSASRASTSTTSQRVSRASSSAERQPARCTASRRRLLGEPAVGSLGADRPKSPRFHQDRRQPHVKWGGNLRHNRDFLLQVQDRLGPAGGFEFNGAQTAIPTDTAALNGFANAFASFLLDVPSRVGRDLTVDRSRHAALGRLQLHPRQVAGHAEADDRSWAAPRVLHAARRPRRARAGSRITIRPRIRSSSRATAMCPANLGVKKYFKNFAPRTGISYRITETIGRAGGLRHQHDSVPRQQLRVQLPGEAEQRLQRAQHLRGGAGSNGGRLPGADSRGHSSRTASSRRQARCS